MIFTDKAAKEKISTLESRITDLEADLVTKDSAIESLNAEIVAKDQTIAENAATIGTLNETVSTLQAEAKANAETVAAKDAEITNLTAEIDKAKNSAADQAAAMLAQVGQPEPLAIVQTESNEAPKMTLEAFNELPVIKRNEFIRNGGKLTR